MSIQFFDPVSAATQAIIDSLTDRSDDSLSAVGTVTPTIGANCKIFTEYLTLGTGSGAYNATVVWPNANRIAGDVGRLIVIAPASTNPTLLVKDGAGTTIYSQTMSGVAHTIPPLTFTFNGTQFTSDQGAS